MRNVSADFLLDPKMVEMFLLPHSQLIAMVIVILKIQGLTQQTHQCPKANFQNHISLSGAKAGPKRKSSSNHKMASHLQSSYKHIAFYVQHKIESNTSLECLITRV